VFPFRAASQPSALLPGSPTRSLAAGAGTVQCLLRTVIDGRPRWCFFLLDLLVPCWTGLLTCARSIRHFGQSYTNFLLPPPSPLLCFFLCVLVSNFRQLSVLRSQVSHTLSLPHTLLLLLSTLRFPCAVALCRLERIENRVISPGINRAPIAQLPPASPSPATRPLSVRPYETALSSFPLLSSLTPSLPLLDTPSATSVQPPNPPLFTEIGLSSSPCMRSLRVALPAAASSR
jgi:hypothetical protein